MEGTGPLSHACYSSLVINSLTIIRVLLAMFSDKKCLALDLLCIFSVIDVSYNIIGQSLNLVLLTIIIDRASFCLCFQAKIIIARVK